MSRRKLLLLVLPLALLSAVAYVSFATHDAPAGQPPLPGRYALALSDRLHMFANPVGESNLCDATMDRASRFFLC